MDREELARGKRKTVEKATARRGRGRGASSSSHREQSAEEVLQQFGYTIAAAGIQGTPDYIMAFDDSYMEAVEGDFTLTAPQNTLNFAYFDYSKSEKAVAEARAINTYVNPRMFDVDERFWDTFQSNFYASAIFGSKKSKIIQMQYIDFDNMRRKSEPEFNAAITSCDRFDLTDIMQFSYNWNIEILSQFHATYFLDQEQDVVHWMTDKTHYRISFLTFCQIFGFSETHRSFSKIHAKKAYEIEDVRNLWREPAKADGKRSGLKSYYYVMNNLIRNTIDPKDRAASDINGYVRNVLARMPDGERFNVPRFMWVQLYLALNSGRRNLPYGPYIMFMIERVTGHIFPKDGFHTPYNIEKARPYAVTKETATRETVGGSSRGREDIPEGSCSRSRSRRGLSGKLKSILRAIFGTCSYVAQTAYNSRMEQRETLAPIHAHEGLPPLAPPPPPPHFDIPDLSGSSSSTGQPSSGWFEPFGEQQHKPEAGPSAPCRSAHFTSTTHRAGHKVVESDDEEATSGQQLGDDVWAALVRDDDDEK